MKIGSWSFLHVPAGWESIAQVGIRRNVGGQSVASVSVIEEVLPEGMSLDQYVQSQVILMQHFLPEPAVIGPNEVSMANLGPALEIGDRYICENGQTARQVQLYVTAGAMVGVVTFTAAENHAAHCHREFDAIRKNLMFHREEPDGLQAKA